MKSFKLLLVLVLGSLVGGCYGRASPDTCHAKHIRDGRGGGAKNYDRCLASYHCRIGDGPCPNKDGRGFWATAVPLAVVGVAAGRNMLPATYVAPRDVSYRCYSVEGYTQCRVEGLDR